MARPKQLQNGPATKPTPYEKTSRYQISGLFLQRDFPPLPSLALIIDMLHMLLQGVPGISTGTASIVVNSRPFARLDVPNVVVRATTCVPTAALIVLRDEGAVTWTLLSFHILDTMLAAHMMPGLVPLRIKTPVYTSKFT